MVGRTSCLSLSGRRDACPTRKRLAAMAGKRLSLLIVLTLVIVTPVSDADAQAPPGYPMTVPSGPTAPPGGPPVAQAPRQGGLQYAFRPDLSNPQYGECLNLERNWQNLWHAYNYQYHQAMRMNQRDPNYVQMTYQLRDLKLQLDAAWHAFSSRCIYFPDPNKP
jgi:hypothetical protein